MIIGELGRGAAPSPSDGETPRRRIRGVMRALLLAESGVPRWLRIVYLALTVVLIGYVISVVARGGQTNSTLYDGWGVDVFELTLTAIAIGRGFYSRQGRGIAFSLGGGLLMWAVGDVFLTTMASPSSPNSPLAADLSYLAFYPLAYAGIALLLRAEVTRRGAPSWLDGVIAGLGAAAVCATFAFRHIFSGWSSLSTAVNLAFPIGDVLLLALVIGGLAIVPVQRRAPWILVATSCSINAIGDTFNLLHTSVGHSSIGETFNAVAWPASILLISLAVWVRSDSRIAAAAERSAGFALPGAGAVAGLTILAIGTLHPVGAVGLGLAIATLVAVGLRLTFSVEALRSINEVRHRQSITDELTGLGNRRYLAQALEQHLGAGETGALSAACLFVDLNRFKEVNDLFGHAAGDEVLRQLGPRLAASLRRTDFLVRLGGDEFAVVLPGTDIGHAIDVAKRLVRSLEEPFPLEIVPVEISASIGIAVAPQHATEINELLRCADVAMYKAKMTGAPYEVYDPDLELDGDPLRLVEELRSAVERGEELHLHFQPQLDLRTGRIAAAEALVRWAHPRLGLMPPVKFISLAEEAGLMPALTERVLDDAVAQCAKWRASGRDVAVSVNVSPSNLLDNGFYAQVKETLSRHGLPPSALVLEITENCVITDYERSRKVIEELRNLGIITSIDDFGAGFTSLAYLGELAVGELKLDRSFVADLASKERERDVELVRSTISLGHALGLRVVAEGIEDRDTLDLLAQFGCDVVQGFIVSKPVAPEDLKLDSPWVVG